MRRTRAHGAIYENDIPFFSSLRAVPGQEGSVKRDCEDLLLIYESYPSAVLHSIFELLQITRTWQGGIVEEQQTSRDQSVET